MNFVRCILSLNKFQLKTSFLNATVFQIIRWAGLVVTIVRWQKKKRPKCLEENNGREKRAWMSLSCRKISDFMGLIAREEEQKDNLYACHGAIGPLVLSILCPIFQDRILNRWDWDWDLGPCYPPPVPLPHGWAVVSQQLSFENPEFMKVFLHIKLLEVCLEATMAADPQIQIQRAFLQFVEKRVDLLCDILNYSLMDMLLKFEGQNELMNYWLKHVFAPVLMESSSSLIEFIPNVLSSKLLHKLKLIKAQMFILELQHHKFELCDDMGVARTTEAFKFLCEFIKSPEPRVFIINREKTSLMRIEALFRKVEKFTADMISEVSLALFKFFKAEAMLMVLIDDNARKFKAMYHLETLQRSLIFLRALISDPTNNDYVEDGDVSAFIETLVSSMTTLVCSLGQDKMGENQQFEMRKNKFSYLSKKIELNLPEIKAGYNEVPRSTYLFPKKDGIYFVEFVLVELERLLTEKPNIISPGKELVEELLGELELLIAFLKDVDMQQQSLMETEQRVVCLIHEAEYTINLFVEGEIPEWYYQMVIFYTIEEIKLIEAHLLEYRHDRMVLLNDVQLPLRSETLKASDLISDEIIVGFDEHARIIVDKLRSGSSQLQFVSIVGMGGLGKTTLARKVYTDHSTQRHFMVRAWCSVSQVYQKKQLLLDLLDCLDQVSDEIRRKSENDLADILYKRLKGKRYLIVIDDIWSTEAWSDLRIILPDDKKGSRILFTSRVHEVVKAVGDTEPYVLNFLSVGDSWDLLEKKLFPGGSCPEDLVQIGMLIAKNCKGLPLAIVVIAGLLKNIENRKIRWEEFAQHFRSNISDNRQSPCMDILEFSYHHLPSHLKPCFLYFGRFPEDKEVPVQKLKMLWIAEGFIPEMPGTERNLEKTAEAYLLELTSRSLVMVAKRRTRGGTKTCRMHDLLRDLCLEKVAEENFMQMMSGKDAPESMYYRFCAHSPNHQLIRSELCGRRAHSLIFHPIDDSDRRSKELSCIVQNFKILRVLDMENMTIDRTFLTEIDLMCSLNYLAVGGNIDSVPSSINQLWNLESLIVKATRGTVAVPSTLWSMQRLRYVQVHPRASFDLPDKESENFVVLENLVSFSSPMFPGRREAEKLLRRITRLKKVRFILGPSWYEKNLDLAFLDELESLKIFNSAIGSPCGFSFPSNIKKLALSNLRLPWKYIETVRKLPNLEVLKLLSRSFDGGIWKMDDGVEFPELKYLELVNLNLAKWDADSESFPVLEQLVLQSCRELEEVPLSFGESNTLQMIDMKWCSRSAESSLDKIYEQQVEELGNKGFKVFRTDYASF